MKSIITLALFTALGTAALAADLGDAQIDPAFSKADADHNGTISQTEAKAFGISASVFKKANPDKDDSLDKGEFVAAIQAMFTAANPDKDGTLDWNEAKKAGVKSKAVFEAANPDKDGTLDMAEYLTALTAQAR